MNQKKRSIVILAAGKGSRLKSNKAKVLHEICGKPMLYHIIKEAEKISDDVSVVIAHQKEQVRKMIESYFDNINFVEQDADKFPGTGGALKNYAPRYEQVLVLNGDMPLVTAEAMEQFFKMKESDIVMSIFDLDDPSGYGRVVIDENEVCYIVEQKDANKKELAVTTVNAGVYAFKRDILEKFIPLLKNDNAQNEYYLTDIIEMAKNEGLGVRALLVDEEHFKGVNSKKDLAEAEMILCRRIRNKWMQKGITMQLPETIYIESDVVFEGECIIEQGCRITEGARIVNSHIKAHSIVEESEVIDSDVGPLAHLRPKSLLRDTHIGNFVEVKKSTLTGVKAGHLSYIGDAEANEGTNIGAGMITCNYDGINKHKTKIGKNVFIGSDSQLVAPVTIEDNVIIAAGTTVPSGTVETGVLAISRAPLKKVKGFFQKFFTKKEKQ